MTVVGRTRSVKSYTTEFRRAGVFSSFSSTFKTLDPCISAHLVLHTGATTAVENEHYDKMLLSPENFQSAIDCTVEQCEAQVDLPSIKASLCKITKKDSDISAMIKSTNVSQPSTCNSIAHQRSTGLIVEENIRMRQAINDMALSLTRWMRQNEEQAERVSLLVRKLQESEEQRKSLIHDLEAMKIQMESCQSDWAAERQEKLAIAKERDRAKEAVLRLQEENRKLIKTDSGCKTGNEEILIDKENELAKRMILKLQEENWALRKARTSYLISRGPCDTSSREFSERRASSFRPSDRTSNT